MFETKLNMALILASVIAANAMAAPQDKPLKQPLPDPTAAQEANDKTTDGGAKTESGPFGTITGQVAARPSKYRQHVVVYIEAIPGKEFKPPEKPVLMDQVKLTFVPHILPVLPGTTVEFKNSDNVLHNVFCPDECADEFNLGSYPKGVVKTHKFDKSGCRAVMLCNVHPEMEAWIVVVDTPYHAVTDKEGKFTIENVPPGSYTLKTWHKKKKPVEQEIVVKENEATEVALKLRR